MQKLSMATIPWPPPLRFHLKVQLKASKSRNLSSLVPLNAEPSSTQNSSERPLEEDERHGGADPIKLAFAKAKAYKKAVESEPTPKIGQKSVQELAGDEGKSDAGILEEKDEGEGNKEVPLSVKLAFEKAKEYRKGKDEITDEFVSGSQKSLGFTAGNTSNSGNPLSRNDTSKKEELRVSSIDFVGLEFSEKKKSKGLPAGLVPQVDPFYDGNLPEVEIIVGDTSKFRDGAERSNVIQLPEDTSELYKPKVSTWGVFPRPSNISKTYGGGRTIQEGETLETPEDKAAKEARTQELLAAYRKRRGLDIDPKLKSECEQALKDGDFLMDAGKLKDALPFYEKVMDKLAFQSKLYGMAALQWSICQDSLTRPNEARIMYEKLQSHPDEYVSKKARQFMFGFQAMEMMKVSSSKLSSANAGYQRYFEAFVKEEGNYPLEEVEVDDGNLKQAIPYMLFLLSPILIVILIAFQKGSLN